MKIFLHTLCVAFFAWNTPSFSAEEKPSAGELLYHKSCVDCHGKTGEGTENYERPLTGDLSVPQLATLIQKTMPEDDPGSLSAEQSRDVAQYVYDAFYSKIARERNAPARIELARLTVRQYRLALADLVGSFRSQQGWKNERGLNAEYFESSRPGDRRKLKKKRVDARIDFEFGTNPPISEIKSPHSFSMRWQGSVLPPETGEYRLTIHTEHAARLWLNDQQDPVIDAWVKSGDDSEFHADVFLIGGQVTPIRLDFSKAIQGVDRKKKTPPPTPTSISLQWKRPSGETEVIAAHDLSPQWSPEVYICDTPFPPDDRSYGWERGTAISKAWDNATTNGAIQTARYVVEHLNELSKSRDGDKDRLDKVKLFCKDFAERAFRRPLTEDQSAWLIDRQFHEAKSIETAVKRVVILTLKSPRFLYREIGGPDQFDVAARLSFGLWDSIPDRQLFDAARSGRLETKQKVADHARRMLNDPRAKQKVRNFLLTWLHAETEMEIGKDPELFPNFDPQIVSDLRTSLERFLDDVVWSEKSDFRQLLLSNDIHVNDRLAKFYGIKRDVSDDFQPVSWEQNQRAGILTHPFLMTKFAHEQETSPIHRGVFVVRGLLGHALKPPPEAVTPLPADLHPKLTTRERVILQTNSTTCMTCHGMINSLGFPLEAFDAVGRLRDKDRGKPVDTSGAYQTRAGQEVQIKDARALGEFLAHSEETHHAFVEQFFHHLVQQSIGAYGPDVRQHLQQEFAKSNYHIRDLAVQILSESALIGRETELDRSSVATSVSSTP